MQKIYLAKISLCFFLNIIVIQPVMSQDIDIRKKYQDRSGMVYLDNGILKVGFRLDWGGGLTYISYKGSPNMVNDFPDPGRSIQVDLRFAESNPTEQGTWWQNSEVYIPQEGFNPAKDYKVGSILLEYRIDYLNNKMWTKTRAYDFNQRIGTKDILTDIIIEKEVSLHENIIRLDYYITYTGEEDFPDAGPHELPALFAHRRFNKWVYYQGEKPWADGRLETITYQKLSQLVLSEGAGTQAVKGLGCLSEGWVSIVDSDDFGLTLAAFDLADSPFIIKAEDHLNKDERFKASAIMRNSYLPVRKGTVIRTTFYIIIDTWQRAREKVYELWQSSGRTFENKH
jgi:hypothetical protein